MAKVTIEKFGMLQLFEGHGKGKTTAALGEVLRAVGAGMKVAIVAFDKGGDQYSERVAIAEYLSDAVDFHGTGRNRIDSVTGRFDFTITDEDKAEGERGLDIVRDILKQGKHDLVMLDEVNSSVALDIIKLEDVLELVESRPQGVEMILTGRNAPDELRNTADLITEMKMHKHYLNAGVRAREGFDY